MIWIDAALKVRQADEMEDDSRSKEVCRLCGEDRVFRPQRKPLEKKDLQGIIKKVIGEAFSIL